ncbi:hypothetical protein T10_3690, partial [Trichinella papuae]
MLFSSREEHNYYLKIKRCENFGLLHVLESSHSRTCLPENACKFLFHCYPFSYVTLVLTVDGVRWAVRVQCCFPCDENHITTLKMALCFVYYFLFLHINSHAFGETWIEV